jgi:hypothetical protein
MIQSGAKLNLGSKLTDQHSKMLRKSDKSKHANSIKKKYLHPLLVQTSTTLIKSK